MSPRLRIDRLVRYYEREKDEAALRLAGVRVRIQEAVRDLRELTKRHRMASDLILPGANGLVDIEHVRLVEGYRAYLRTDIDRKRRDIETLKREEDQCHREAMRCYREFKMWEKVRDKRVLDDRDLQRLLTQRELDDLAIHRKAMSLQWEATS